MNRVTNYPFTIFRRGWRAFFALSLLLIPILSVPSALAQTKVGSGNSVPNGFSISPVLSQVTISKGNSSTLTIYVQNPTSQSTIAHPIVNDFVASSDESGTPRLIVNPNQGVPENDFRTLVGNLADISLGPNQQKSIQVTLHVPNNATAGGYYGAIRFVPIVSGQQSNLGLTASVGTLVLVTVPGNLTEKLSLVQLSAAEGNSTGSFFIHGNLSVVTRLKNTGDIHVAPYGNIEVKNMFGHLVASVQLNNTSPRGNILPNSVRRFSNSLPKKHWFGYYTIYANIGYGSSSNNLVSAQASFVYLPIWALIIAVVILIIIIWFIYWLVHLIKTHRIKQPKLNR